jgi:spermidine/putrescine ABC transporter ATP-binding subunit
VEIRLEQLSAVFRHDNRGDVLAVRSINVEIRPGELLTLLGPSGCGKTTTLRMIAGFQEPSAGRIFVGGEDITSLPANRRDMGFVFQNYALFPHLSVFENVAYGLRVKGTKGQILVSEANDALRLVGLTGLGERMINELSGGQQQRVALARAIVIQPRVLLFDEPLSNLDAKLRVEVRGEIAELQHRLGITTVYVTHDQEEAMAISNRIAVMEAGQIAQIGTAEELYRRPASGFVAEFLGHANILRGTVQEVAADRVTLVMASGRLDLLNDSRPETGTRVKAVIRPEAIRLAAANSVSQGFHGCIISRVYLGDKVEYNVQIGDDQLYVIQSNPPEYGLFEPGAAVSVLMPNDGVQLLLGDQA